MKTLIITLFLLSNKLFFKNDMFCCDMSLRCETTKSAVDCFANTKGVIKAHFDGNEIYVKL